MHPVYAKLRLWQQRRIDLEMARRLRKNPDYVVWRRMLREARANWWMADEEYYLSCMTQAEDECRSAICEDNAWLIDKCRLDQPTINKLKE